MKLVTFSEKDGVQYIGALVNNGRTIARLQAGAQAMEGAPSPFFTGMLAFLQGGAAARDKARATVEYITTQDLPGGMIAVDGVTLLAPVPRPESIRDCMSFEQHIINCIRVVGLKKLTPFDEWIERVFGRGKSLAGRANRTFYERPVYYKGNRLSVIGSGTCSGAEGRGCGLEMEKFLQVGDRVELEVERVGILRNRVHD